MLDIRFVRENPEAVKENIRKKFQEEKLVLVDEVLALDKEFRASKTEGDSLRGDRNRLSKTIGGLMQKGEKDKAEEVKLQVAEINRALSDLEEKEHRMEMELREKMLVIPQMIDDSVPIGKDDSENVEI